MVKYGKECDTDENCSSGVCEMTYNDADKQKRFVLSKNQLMEKM